MRAYEIQESITKLPVIAQGPSGTWYKTDAAGARKWYKQMYGGNQKIADDPNITYILYVPNGTKVWGLNNGIVALKGKDLESVFGDEFYNQEEQGDLQALADATGAENGDSLYGNFILYKGKVYNNQDVLLDMPKVGGISTGSVYEVPKDARWILNRLNLRYQTSADRVVVFKNGSLMYPWSTVSIRDGQVGDVQSRDKLGKAVITKLAQEVSSVLGLEQKLTVTSYLIPKTKLHKTLQAISNNPGVDRPNLYWKVLKLQKLPSWKGPNDVATELVNLGLVDVDQKGYQLYYTITTPGSLVLAALDSGTPIKKTDLMDL